MRRARIDVTEPLHEQVDQTWEALLEADVETRKADPEADPQVLVRGNTLVRMTERGALEAIPKESLRERMSEVIQFERPKGDDSTPVPPPMEVVTTLQARDSARYLGGPRVERVVDVPVLGPNHALITEVGHHEDGGIFYRPAEGLKGVAPLAADTTEDVEWALDLLLEDYLGDFGFVDESSRAHALALLLLPFVREAIDGPTPLHLVVAPEFGTGKTYLAQACLLPSCGIVPTTSPTKNEEEWRKRITASLIGGGSAVILDNLSGTLDSGALASALTTGVWQDRVLGESREVTLPVRNAWVGTGNDLDLAPEQVRRAIPIQIEPGDVLPEERPSDFFRHPDLLGWATENRSELVKAALTLIEHWRLGAVEEVEGGYVYKRADEAAPREGTKTLGSFERWARVMGGILDAAGVPGFLENRDDLRAEANEEAREATEFIRALHGVLNGYSMEAREIASYCVVGGQLHEVLPVEVAAALPEEPMGSWNGDKTKAFNVALAAWMTKHRGKRFAGFKLLSKKQGKGARTHWYVQDRSQG